MDKKGFKRGELTSATIIPLVLLIAGFGVLLFVGYQLFFAEDGGDLNTQRQLCQLSVLTRATANERLQASVPLKCTTEKICISESGGDDCLDSFAGEKNIQQVSLKEANTEKSKAGQIDFVTAQAMYDCWNMMHEGKLDIFGSYSSMLGLKPTEPTCVICSRIAVDKLQDETKRQAINELLDLDDFLQNTLAPQSSKTYMELFTDKDVRSYPNIKEVPVTGNKNVNLYAGEDASKVNYVGDNKYLGEIAVVFMQIRPTGYKKAFGTLFSDGGALAAGAFLLPGGKWATRVLFQGLKTPVGAVLAGAAIIGGTSYVIYNVNAGRSSAAGYCGEFTSALGEKEKDNAGGCSIVQVMPYSVKMINEFCKGGIQGLP